MHRVCVGRASQQQASALDGLSMGWRQWSPGGQHEDKWRMRAHAAIGGREVPCWHDHGVCMTDSD